MTIKIIGAGLAGSEAAWHLINRNIPVEIYEMRPEVSTKAHKTGKCAELVCSNSLKNSLLNNAAGLLKEEMRMLGSIMMQSAEASEVPAGAALAVDRNIFSNFIDEKLRNHPLVTFRESLVDKIPNFSKENPVIIATGPLTHRKLTEHIESFLGLGNLAFFDAIAPIFFASSLNKEVLFKMSRYNKGGDDYYNIPLNEEEYFDFINEVKTAEKYTGNEDVENDSLDKLRPFEGCMPIEDLIERGDQTIRFGPLKPKGLFNPHTQNQPYAVIQLRQDDKQGNTWSMVGMQTRMKRQDQQRIFSKLPGLENAEFARYGSFHRNTFIDSPKCLNNTLETRKHKGLFFAGQITGVEGYLESGIGGILAGINAYKCIKGENLVSFPSKTAAGSLFNYISNSERKDFQPMNITYGIMDSYFAVGNSMKKKNKQEQRIKTSELAIEKNETI